MNQGENRERGRTNAPARSQKEKKEALKRPEHPDGVKKSSKSGGLPHAKKPRGKNGIGGKGSLKLKHPKKKKKRKMTTKAGNAKKRGTPSTHPGFKRLGVDGPKKKINGIKKKKERPSSQKLIRDQWGTMREKAVQTNTQVRQRKTKEKNISNEEKKTI